MAKKHNKPVIVMEPVKGGSLANISEDAQMLFKNENKQYSIASWAIKYAASLDNVIVVLSGMSNEEQLMDNMSYMKDFQPLNEKEYEVIEKAKEIIKSNIAIPCTSCHYCTENCPKQIAIPEYFSIYNNYKRFGESQYRMGVSNYEKLNDKFGKASDCIECNQCEEHCPQHLKITNYLKEIAKVLEVKE